MQQIKKIVVIGPESTGKSSLCESLAHHFNSVWAKEYAMEYLVKHGAKYAYEDLNATAEGQVAEEEAAIKNTADGAPLFIDTDLYVIKVWSEFVFNKCNSRILTQIAHRKYDLYLLCNTDLPWVKDELREYPDLKTRERLFHYYKDLLVNQHTPWVTISGQHEERLQQAIEATENLFR